MIDSLLTSTGDSIRYTTATIASSFFFFFNDTATTEIYTLSLHDALPIFERAGHCPDRGAEAPAPRPLEDRKSTRLNSSHLVSSYAVFGLKKKKTAKASINPSLEYVERANKDAK